MATSVPTLIRCFTKAAQTYLATPNAPDRAIGADLYAKLDRTNPASLFSRLLAANAAVEASLSTQVEATAGLGNTADSLGMFVSHFHQVLDLAIARNYFGAGTRPFYGRDANATTIPDIGTYDALAEAAQKIADGEAARHTAEGANFMPMAMPSANEVGDAFGLFNEARVPAEAAQHTTNVRREALAALAEEALAVAVDIYDTVEFFYRKDPDPSSRREKCARWGVVYIYGSGETPPMPEQADINNITTPGPGQVHFHYDAVNALTFDVLHKAPLATEFVKVADDVEAKVYQGSGLAVGAHEFKVVGRNAAGDGPESAVAVVQIN